MSCEHCRMAISREISRVAGVLGFQVDLKAKTIEVDLDASAASPEDVKGAIRRAGYTVSELD
ncbi:MAG: heavy-metal-associated domain-containing protein [Bacillota bacterium]